MARKDPTWKFGWKPSDVVVIIIIFAIIYAVAIWSGIVERRDQAGKKHKRSGVDFFLGGRHMGWILVGVSIAASNIGTDVLVALTGSVASAGLGGMAYEIGSGWSILCLGWFMGPMYLRSLLRTIPEYMEDRYNPYCRVIFVLFSVAIFILSKLGVNVYSGSLIFQTMVGEITLWAFVPVIVVITALYTFVGGLTSVMWADLVQLFIFLASGYASTGFLLGKRFEFNHKLGNLQNRMNELGLNHLQHLIQPKDNPDYPWPATTIGMLVHEYYYWSADQEMAQRVISSKGLGDARMGCALGSILKVACFFCSVVPGWAARTFYEECKLGIGHPTWCGPNALAGDFDMSDGSDANRAYPLLVMREFPQGFKGIMIAGFIAAVMSNLSGAINSLSTILTYDIYVRFFPPKKGQKFHSQRRLVFVGRTLVIICAGITLVCYVPTQLQPVSDIYRQGDQYCKLPSSILLLFLYALYHLLLLNMGVTLTCNIIVSLATPKPDYAKIERFSIQWEDLIPRYVTWFLPKYKKEALDYGYIDGIRREALTAQNAVDKEYAELRARKKGNVGAEQTGDRAGNGAVDGTETTANGDGKKSKFGFLNKFNGKKKTSKNTKNQEEEVTVMDPRQAALDPENAKQADGEFVDPLLNDKYLEAARKDQYLKMQIADFMAIAAFFFTTFMYVWFR